MSAQRGAALAVSLVVLLLLSLLALCGARLGAMELQLARGGEQALAAFEQAQSLVDLCLRSVDLTPPMRQSVLCAGQDCAKPLPELAAVIEQAKAGDSGRGASSLVIRGLPVPDLPPLPGSGYSADKLNSVQLRIEVSVTQDEHGAGAAQIFEGVALLQWAGADVLRSGNEARDTFRGP